jgi:hypothetical protein
MLFQIRGRPLTVGTEVNFSSTKIILALPLILLFLTFVVPSFWPQPAVEAVTPLSVVAGDDMEITLRIRTWHENFHLRLVRVTINDMASPAYNGKAPLLPLTLLREDMVEQWDLGLLSRVTFPRTLSLELLAPFAQLYRKGVVGRGTLRGSITVEIDHTKAQVSGEYPLLVLRQGIPFEVDIVN